MRPPPTRTAPERPPWPLRSIVLPVLITALSACSGVPGEELEPLARTGFLATETARQAPKRVAFDFDVHQAAGSQRSPEGLAAFLAGFQQAGLGPLDVSVPRNAPAASRLDVEKLLNSAAPGPMHLNWLERASPDTNAVVRLSYLRAPPRSATCAHHMEAPGLTQGEFTAMRCMARAAFIAQLDDPADLWRPRRETPRDARARVRAVESLSKPRPSDGQPSVEALKQ